MHHQTRLLLRALDVDFILHLLQLDFASAGCEVRDELRSTGQLRSAFVNGDQMASRVELTCGAFALNPVMNGVDVTAKRFAICCTVNSSCFLSIGAGIHSASESIDHRVVKRLAVSACVSFVVELRRDLRIAGSAPALDPRYSDFEQRTRSASGSGRSTVTSLQAPPCQRM